MIFIGFVLIFANSCKKAETKSKKDPVITWANPADISYGTLLSAAQLNATADIPGTFVYTPAIGTKLEVGTNQVLKVDFTPTDATVYNIASKTVQINVTAASNTVTDIDGNVYHTVTIGTQVWLIENLRVTKYQNGDLIGTTNPATLDISAESTPKYQWAYEGNESNVPTYGRLYTWYAITDSRGVCPVGWHIPSSNEWYTMLNYLLTNGYNYDGSTSGNISMNSNGLAKALASATGWDAANNIGAVGNTDFLSVQNITGFSALPGGVRNLDGTFSDLGKNATWWNSTVYTSVGTAFIEYMNYNYNYITWSYADKKFGFSIRCIKN